MNTAGYNNNMEEQKGNGDIIGSSVNGVSFSVGKNERYLINKLKSYNISLDKIDGYLAKLRQDNTLD